MHRSNEERDSIRTFYSLLDLDAAAHIDRPRPDVYKRQHRLHLPDRHGPARALLPAGSLAGPDGHGLDRGPGRLQRAGACLLYTSHTDSGGFYIEPTIFDCADASSALIREEIFGPVLAAQRFHTEDEAIALANDSSYGLGAGLWTANLGLSLIHI